MTDRIEAGARDYLAKIDELGGMVAAIEQGYVQREIQNTAYRTQLEIERGDRVIVGLNEFVATEEEKIPILRVDPRLEAEQVARVRAVRALRDDAEARAACAAVEAAARTEENLMPPILRAVKAYATVGEISDALRAVFGEHQETLTI